MAPKSEGGGEGSKETAVEGRKETEGRVVEQQPTSNSRYKVCMYCRYLWISCSIYPQLGSSGGRHCGTTHTVSWLLPILRYYPHGKLALAEQGFPFHPLRPFPIPLLMSLVLGLFCFLLGTARGHRGHDGGIDTAVVDYWK